MLHIHITFVAHSTESTSFYFMQNNFATYNKENLFHSKLEYPVVIRAMMLHNKLHNSAYQQSDVTASFLAFS